MRPLRYSINVTLDGCCDHLAGSTDDELHRYWAEKLAAPHPQPLSPEYRGEGSEILVWLSPECWRGASLLAPFSGEGEGQGMRVLDFGFAQGSPSPPSRSATDYRIALGRL
jgi:hypothetical protein